MKIYKNIAEAKKEIGAIAKDSKNPFFKSKYFDINALLSHVEPILQNHGLIVLQPIINNKVFSTLVDVETGETIESSIDLPQINDPQKLGSAITYYRRYTLQSLLSLQAEDDDGNLAAKPISYDRQKASLNACSSIEELGKIYMAFSPNEKVATLELKDKLKKQLTTKTA